MRAGAWAAREGRAAARGELTPRQAAASAVVGELALWALLLLAAM